MEVTSLGYRTDLMLRRLGGSEISDRGSHLVIRTPANPGYWWGNFLLLREQPAAGEWPGWAAEFAREFPAAEHLALGLDTTSGEIEGAAALGLEVTVDSVLTARSLTRPAPPWPEAEIRPLRSAGDWAQQVRLRLSLDEEPTGPGHTEFVEQKASEYRALCESGHGAWFGAFIDGEMRCGAGIFGDGGTVARYQNVETHPEYRRRGLASVLVHELGGWGLRNLGAQQLVIVADPDYHAIDLYRRLGFTDAERLVQLQRPPASYETR